MPEENGQVPELLANAKNNGSNVQPNINDISSYYPDGMPAPVKQAYNPFTPGGQDLTGQVTNPGAMPNDVLYPVYSNPYTGNINKGSYSGSIVGNIPIFVDSSLPSFAATDERQKQLQMAAANKAKEIKDLQAKLYEVPQLKNAPDQPEMNNIYLNGIEKWKQQYNGDVKAMQQDPRFNSWLNDVKTAGRINDAAYDQYAAMAKDLDEGKKYFSPETVEAMKGFTAGLATLQDPTDPNSKNFTSKAFKLNQSYDLDLAVNDLLKEYQPSVTEEGPEIKSRGIYDTITTKKKTNANREEIRNLGKKLYKSKFEGKGTFSEEEVIHRVEEALRYQEDLQIQTHANQFAPKAEGAGDKNLYSYDQKETNRDISLNSNRSEKQDKNSILNTSLSSVYKLSAADQAKPIKLAINNSSMRYTDGSKLGTTGHVVGGVSDIGVAKVFKPGVKIKVKVPKLDKNGAPIKDQYTTELKDVGGLPVDQNVAQEYANNPALYNEKPVAIFNVTEDPTGNNKGKNKTLIIPVDDVANAFINPNKKQGQVDVTDLVNDIKKDAQIKENERHAKVVEYAATLKKDNKQTTSSSPKKSVSSGSKSGGLKPVGDL